MKVIYCFIGKARHGKDTAAELTTEILRERGFPGSVEHKSFAKLLKEQAKMLGWDGEKDERGRTLLQELSAPVKRYHGQNYYAEYVLNEIRADKNKDSVYLITDMRYKNEYFLYRDLKDEDIEVKFIKIVRPETNEWRSPLTLEQQNHQSEVDLDDVDFKVVLKNSGTLHDLKTKLEKVV